MPLCLSSGALAATLAVQSFTLAWTHSVEKTRWEEEWQIADGQLLLSASRVKGFGAGMEPTPGAVLCEGALHSIPAVAPLPVLRLTHSPYTTGYELCAGGQCRPLSEYLPGLPETAIIELSACRE